MTNSGELPGQVNANEQSTEGQNSAITVKEEDQSYAKGSLGTKSDKTEGATRFWESSGTSCKIHSHST